MCGGAGPDPQVRLGGNRQAPHAGCIQYSTNLGSAYKAGLSSAPLYFVDCILGGGGDWQG